MPQTTRGFRGAGFLAVADFTFAFVHGRHARHRQIRFAILIDLPGKPFTEAKFL